MERIKPLREELLEEIEKSKAEVGKWIASQRREAERLKEQHVRAKAQKEEKIRDLNLQLKTGEASARSIQRELEEEQRELRNMLASLDRMRDKENVLPHELELLRLQHDKERKKMDEYSKAVREKEKEKNNSMGEVTKGITYYRERLGLDFQRLGQDRLRFVFIYLDPNDYGREFSFSLRVDTNNSYKVEECLPEVEGITSLVKTLNKNNDLGQFVLLMRKKFKESVAEEQS